ncbi:large subunit ribosomal protein L24 [Thermosulfidibacter takaii ABI70S6]|uniref:Large ribosomal subunit protein uL24 n=1 Tax=Thermosulfidibacter takaii (strain DSM 17441 / JCM 13301 / NBRC 103674 / ABI70S6) TaxID=1298851 RepID=A0A0S3QV85_THET7|nr:50S ribosomal protein L24 [Thermosulfidibacter takaii]BAT72211.1 large subunit ribosomal protein L24 [Thermosulfidibacter takaii ABI70S6]
MAAKIKREDFVVVIAGKDKGKKGKVLRVIPKRQRVVVEGVNIVKKHQKPTATTAGGIIEKEAPIHVSNVMLVCPKCGKATRVGFAFLEDGTKVRKCKKCQEVIDK